MFSSRERKKGRGGSRSAGGEEEEQTGRGRSILLCKGREGKSVFII